MKYFTGIISCLVLFTLLRCSQKRNSKALKELPASETQIDFINTVDNSATFNIFNYRNFYNGGGVSIGDINGDTLPDLYFASNMGSNKLYLNKGDFVFEDISQDANIGLEDKWSTGVSMVDINHDGHMDIYVSNAGYRKGQNQKNALFINNGDLTFAEKAEEYGLDDAGYTTHSAFFDYDLDGDLDVYLLNNSFIPVNTLNYSNDRERPAKDWDIKDFLKGGGDKLMRNDNGRFVDVTEDAGIYSSLIGFGLGVTLGDLNHDGYVDIYISNDFFERDYLYMNKGDGTFSEELEKRIGHISHSSMGADIADINNDSYGDIFVTDMLPDDEYRLKTTASFDNIDVFQLKKKQGFYNQFMHNTLQLNSPSGHFKEIANYAHVAASDWSWGALIFDIDNDLWQDIVVCNGIYHDVIDRDFIEYFSNEIIQKMVVTGKKENLNNVLDSMPSNPIRNKIFKNLGNYQFEDVSESWGIESKTFSNGAAYGDLDNDGDLDLVINNVNQPAQIYKNESENNFLKIKLSSESANKNAIGARVYVYADSFTLFRENIPFRGFQSSVDYNIVFGLGQKDRIDSLVVLWPLGSKSVLVNPTINSRVELNENTASSKPSIAENTHIDHTLLTPQKLSSVNHSEDTFNDFYYDRGLISMLSQEGPKADVADVNNDGHMDVFIGGAAGQPGVLMLGSAQGFNSSPHELHADVRSEDVAVHFFDADGDGDQDLYVGSGGNIALAKSRPMRDRLYMNDGLGNFKLKEDALPLNGNNTSVVISYDYNSDGFLDLFVGSRSIPSKYGLPPKSYIFRNKGNGKFSYETIGKNKSDANFGMVTDAKWVDIMGDSNKELVVVSEWLAPQIYQFDGETLNSVGDSSNLNEYSGWWRSVDFADLDNDGDEDLILGNLGENFYLKASKSEPIKLWIADFDQNGSFERIMTRTVDSKDMPVALKNDLIDQIVAIRKENVFHRDYANKSIQDLFSPEVLKQALVFGANFMQSAIAYNMGNGQFDMQPLPFEAQLSCINDAIAIDIDNDNDLDIALGGNHFEWLPQFSRQDANFGLILENKNGHFEAMPSESSGLFVKGEIKQFLKLSNDNNNYLLVLLNNESPLLYKYN